MVNRLTNSRRKLWRNAQLVMAAEKSGCRALTRAAKRFKSHARSVADQDIRDNSPGLTDSVIIHSVFEAIGSWPDLLGISRNSYESACTGIAA